MSRYGDWRIRIYDRFRYPIAEVEPIDFHCVWSTNEQGTAELLMSTRYDPKCTRWNLRVGNFVEFAHARLGTWVGVIIPHDGREGHGNGQIVIRMRDATVQFSRRRAPIYDMENNKPVLEGLVGKAIDWIVRQCNVREDTGLRVGDVWSSADRVFQHLLDRMFSDLIDAIVGKRRKKLFLWVTSGRDESNLLVCNVNVVERATLRGGGYIVLQEDINIETPSGTFWREDGNLVNDLIVRNEGDQDGELIRKWGQDAESIGEHGLWEGVETISTDEESVVEWWRDEVLRARSHLERRPILTIIESAEQPEFFSQVRAGKVARVLLHSQNRYYGDGGFDEMVQLVSLEYSVLENRVMATPEFIYND